MKQQWRLLYGWVVVAVSALGLLFGAFPIVVSSFAIFFPSYLREFHAGRGAISLALMIHNLLAASLAVWIGRLTDRFGARKVILPGLGIFCLLLLSAEAIGSSIWQLYVFYALLGIVSDTTTSVPYGVLVCRWFNRRRGLAVGLAQAGLGLGAIVAPPVVQQLIAGYGWRSAFAILGGVMLVIPIPIIALFMKDAPGRMGSLPDGTPAAQGVPGPAEGFTWGQIRNSRTFWLMVTAFVLAGASVQGCIIHMAQLLSDRGASAGSAALAVSVAGLALMTGRAGTGLFLDRYFGPHVAMCLFAAASLGIGLLWVGATGVPALVGAFLVGLSFGAEFDIIAYLMSRYFGLRALGTAFGFAFGGFVLAGGLGPLVMGFGFDRSGSYQAPLAGFFVAAMAAAGLMITLGPYRFGVTRKPQLPAAAA